MKIGTFTLSVLENFAAINPAAWIAEGNVIETVSPTKAIVARVTVDTTFPRNFGLYRVNQLIQTLSMYQDPEITFRETELVVSSGMRSTKLAYGDPTLFKPCTIPSTFKFPTSEIKTSISSVVLNDLHKAVRVLGVEDLVIEGDGASLRIFAKNAEDKGSNYHAIRLGDTDKTFTAVVKHANMTLLSEDYEVEIVADKKHPALKFSTNRIEYVVALDEKSEF